MQKNILISGVSRGIGKQLLIESLKEGYFGLGLEEGFGAGGGHILAAVVA